MKALSQVFLVGLVTSILQLAGAAETEAVKKDMAALQGEWTMVSGSADGQPIPEEMRKDMKRVCKGDETKTTVGEQVFVRAKFTIDPTKKPKTIDYQMLEGFTKGKTQFGIYEIEGDTLKVCFAAPDEERPADFTNQPGDHRTSSVWKRQTQSGKEPPAKEPPQK